MLKVYLTRCRKPKRRELRPAAAISDSISAVSPLPMTHGSRMRTGERFHPRQLERTGYWVVASCTFVTWWTPAWGVQRLWLAVVRWQETKRRDLKIVMTSASPAAFPRVGHRQCGRKFSGPKRRRNVPSVVLPQAGHGLTIIAPATRMRSLSISCAQ